MKLNPLNPTASYIILHHVSEIEHIWMPGESLWPAFGWLRLCSCLKGVLFTGNLDMQYVKVIKLITKTWLQPEVEEETFSLWLFLLSHRINGRKADCAQALWLCMQAHWENVTVTISFCNSCSGSNAKVAVIEEAYSNKLMQIELRWTEKLLLLNLQLWVACSVQHIKFQKIHTKPLYHLIVNH